MNNDYSVKVLDHGYVKLLNVSGPTRRLDQDFDASDIDPPNTARMSFDSREAGRTEDQDMKLAEYLMKNKHSTPFEMVEVWMEMKLPIFVARQFVRHRTVSLNEVSARYVMLPDEWYVPEVENINTKAVSNKQGRTAEEHLLAKEFRKRLNAVCKRDYEMYGVYTRAGVAPELCRMYLHLNHFTKWVWKQNLHNLFHFLSLRDHHHAQWEAQQYAKAITTLLRQVLPKSMDLYDKYRRLP